MTKHLVFPGGGHVKSATIRVNNRTLLYLFSLLMIMVNSSLMAVALKQGTGDILPDISETHDTKGDRKLRGDKKAENVKGGQIEKQADKKSNSTQPREKETPKKEETLEYTGGWKKDFADEDQYLYGENGLPVIDYHATKDMENPMRPDFLFSKNNPARIVEFYAVWCPHCRHFRSHYIQLAKQVTAIAEDNKLGEIKVYAVACNLYREICKQYHVEGFPQIRLFKANSTEVVNEVQYWEAHAFDMLQTLGLSQPAQDFGGKMDPIAYEEEDLDLNNPKTVSMIQKHHRTKSELYNDAYLSFDFSLRNGIFMTNGALDNKTANVFYEWLELVKRATPVAWKVGPIVNKLLEEFETVKKGDHELVKVLDSFPPPESKKWSLACTHGEKGAGYTCGLWEFFHIITMGVVEWNLMIYEGDHMILSTEEASRRLRNFVEKFFGCNECRMNFVNAYDQCGFDRCHRLKEPDDPTAENTQEEWMELPLWLFETHNAVNLRLMKERAQREGATWTHEDEIHSQWPSRKDCPRCWREDGAWDDLYVYKYLRAEYWPDDSITELYRTALNEPLPVFDDDEFSPSSSKMPSVFVQLIPILVVAGVGIWWFIRKEEVRRSGLHKRIE